MELASKLRDLSARLAEQLHHIGTEEATKNALVMPFISALGYDVFNPTVVTPEYVADVGVKKGEKVDYAILIGSKPVMLFECKAANVDLDSAHASQLYRYFSVTDARFAVLTNGVVYRFFTDLEARNRMDSKPFLEVDLTNLTESVLSELEKFSEESFDQDRILETATDLKYTKEIKRIMGAEFAAPSEEFVRFIGKRVYEGKMTQAVREQFTQITKTSLKEFLSERVSHRLKSALAKEEDVPLEGMASEPDEDEPDNGVETTDAEWQGYYVVKAIVSKLVDPSRVVIRDQRSYCSVILDNNNRKPICRLWFNTSQKYLGVFDAEKNETRKSIDGVEDIYNFSTHLRETVQRYAEAE